MNSIPNRIELIIKYYNMSYNSFAKSLGLANGTGIKTMIDNNRNPQNQTLNKIVNTYPEIDMNWLRTGAGKMISNLPESLSSNDDLTVTAKQVISQLDINNLHYTEMLEKKLSDDREHYNSVTEFNTDNHSKNIASLLDGFKSLENRLETKFQEQEIKMDVNATKRAAGVSQVIGEKIDAMNKHWDIINQEKQKLFLTALDKVISLEKELEDIKTYMAANFELDKMNKKKSKQIKRLNPKKDNI